VKWPNVSKQKKCYSRKAARELAAKSGENITQAITSALEERLQRLRGRSKAIDLAEEMSTQETTSPKIPLIFNCFLDTNVCFYIYNFYLLFV
jgi:hypothetical protein